MIIACIINAVEIPDEGPKQSTDFQSGMPVAGGASKP
jgi:hypothetical protein